MSYYSSILPSVFVNGAPRALIVETKSNQSQGWEATLLEVLHSCLMSGYRWEVRCLRLKTSTLKPCHIICQLGSALDSVDGVMDVFYEPTFRVRGEGALGPLHTWAKSRDHEILRAPKKVSKGCLKTPPKSCSVVTDLKCGVKPCTILTCSVKP